MNIKLKKDQNKVVFKELYGKYDLKIPSDKKIEKFKWEFITSSKRENDERNQNGS